MNIKRILGKKRSRKYPIRRDGDGKSLRQRCFKLFPQEMRPGEVAAELNMKISTVQTYFKQWKKESQDSRSGEDYLKRILKQPGPEREKTISLLSRVFRLPEDNIEEILAKPYGLRHLLVGKVYTPGHEDADFKRRMSFEIGEFIANYVTAQGGKFVDVLYTLLRYVKEQRAYREWLDEGIEENNKEIAFIRQFLEEVAQSDQHGRPVVEQLTRDEMNEIYKHGMDAKLKQVTELYWKRVDELMGSGLTEEQAFEKMYQDSANQGDLRSAMMMRSFQKTERPSLKSEPNHPPSPSDTLSSE